MKFALCARGNLTLPQAYDLLDTGEYSFEHKLDGVRVQMQIMERGVDIYTRNGMALASKFPHLVEMAKQMFGPVQKVRGLPGTYILLDGELVMPSFKHRDIQAAVASNDPSVGREARFYVFDLLATPALPEIWRENYLLRKSQLSELSSRSRCFDVVTTNSGNAALFSQAWDQYLEAGGEGFVLKKNRAPYVGGNSNNWLRSKYTQTISVLPLDVNDCLTVDLSLWTGEGCGSVMVGSVQVPEDDLLLILNDRSHRIVLEVEAFGVDDRTCKLRHPVYKNLRFDIDSHSCTTDQLDSLRSY